MGWRASARLIDESAEALRLGQELPSGAATFGTPPEPVPRIGSGAHRALSGD